MNVVFLSPHFPPQYYHFCAALRAEGARVCAIADTPYDELAPEVRAAVEDFYYVRDMHDYDAMVRALGYFTHRHGKIARLDSLNEHWLEIEARLREDFNIFGQRPEDTARNRSKTAMREIFQKAGIACTEGEPVGNADDVRAFARRHGYPLVFKPDVGVGAARTFRVSSDEELEGVLVSPPRGYVVEKFVHGALGSYDGLTARNGEIVFETAHRFSTGIMEAVNEARHIHYYSRRIIPEGIRAMGRRIVEAFGVRERFFHVEIFETEGGSLLALEINVRPPGGFTTDMMNYTCDFDVYRLWAKVLCHGNVPGFSYERKYHCAYVSRRLGRRYRVPHDEVLLRLGPMVVWHRAMPSVLAAAMGDYFYMVRHPELPAIEGAIALIEEME